MPDRTPSLWTMTESIESAQRHVAIAGAHPSRSLVVNRDEISDVLQAAEDLDPSVSHHEIELGSLPNMPVPAIVIGDPAYAPSLFFEGFNYVSRRLRDVMNLSNDVVCYRPTDTSGCVEPARSAGYMTLQALHVSDPIDQERSDGIWVEMIGRDGRSAKMWMPAGGPTRPAPRIALRAGYRPPAALFRLPNGGPPIVTDEFAEHILGAGIMDVTFVRLDQERGQTANVCKSA